MKGNFNCYVMFIDTDIALKIILFNSISHIAKIFFSSSEEWDRENNENPKSDRITQIYSKCEDGGKTMKTRFPGLSP